MSSYFVDRIRITAYVYSMESIPGDEIKARIIDILNYGSFILSGHAKDRMDERNYSVSDIKNILKYGQIVNFSEKEKDKYHCEVHGKDLDGDNGAVITIVVKNTKLIILTVLGGV